MADITIQYYFDKKRKEKGNTKKLNQSFQMLQVILGIIVL